MMIDATRIAEAAPGTPLARIMLNPWADTEKFNAGIKNDPVFQSSIIPLTPFNSSI
jgi:hypothetical protein